MSRDSSPSPRSDYSDESDSEVNEIFHILFDKTNFFDKTNKFEFFFPNSSYPRNLTVINNRVEVPFFSSFVSAFCKKILIVLNQNSFRLQTLPSPVIKYAIRFLNRFFMFLFKKSKQQKKLSEKKKIEKIAKKRNYWRTKLDDLKNNLKNKFVSSSVDESTSMVAELESDDNTDKVIELNTEKKKQIQTPFVPQFKKYILREIITKKFNMQYDSVVRLQFRYREIVSYGKEFSLFNNDIYRRCSRSGHYYECSCPPILNLQKLREHIVLRKMIKSLLGFFPLAFFLFDFRRDKFTGTYVESKVIRYSFNTLDEFFEFRPEDFDLSNIFLSEPTISNDFIYRFDEFLFNTLSRYFF